MLYHSFATLNWTQFSHSLLLIFTNIYNYLLLSSFYYLSQYLILILIVEMNQS